MMALNVSEFSEEIFSNSGLRYTFTLRITEESVDINRNCSAIKAEVLLQNGLSKTLFVGQPVTITMKINGQTVINRDAWRAYTGPNQVVFETWAGDIPHDDDGKLNLSVEATWDARSTSSYVPQDVTASGTVALTEIVLNVPPGVPSWTADPGVVPVNGNVSLSWSVPEDPEGNLISYKVERSDDGGSSFAEVYNGSAAACVDQAPAAPGTQMLYRVLAIDEKEAVSQWSEQLEVRVNTPPVMQAGPVVYSSATGTAHASRLTAGRPVWIFPGRYTDADNNAAALCFEMRTENLAGVVSDWRHVLDAPVSTKRIAVEIDTAPEVQRLRYRVACADAMDALSDWTELDWLNVDTPFSVCDGQRTMPVIDREYVMPYVYNNGKWLRHGGDDLQIPELPALKDRYNWYKEGNTAMITKSSVRELHFVREFIPPSGARSWNAGIAEGAITGYIVDDVVTISANGCAGIRIGANGANITNAFSSMKKLERVTGLDLIDASGASSLAGLFASCPALLEADLSTWCCDEVTSLNGMFNSCTALKWIRLPCSLPKCTVAYGVLSGCSALEFADLGGLLVENTASQTNYPIFAGCVNLKEAVIPAVSMLADAIDNGAPLFDGCNALEKLTIRTGSTIPQESLFEDNFTIKEIVFNGGLIAIPANTFAKCISLENVSGLGRVTKVGTRAFIYCSSLKKLDLNPQMLAEIGESAFRLSCAEDILDMRKLPSGCSVARSATRAARWSPEDLTVIQNADLPTVLLNVPHADSQKNYSSDKYIFGRAPYPTATSPVTDITVALGGCQLMTLYHEWQCIHCGTVLEQSNFEAFWDEFFNDFYTEEYIFHDAAVEKLGWKCNMKYVNGGGMVSEVIDRLNKGVPTNATMRSANINGYHAVLIIGSDANTRKLAVLDSNITDKAELIWVKFEDVFTGTGDYDRLHFHALKTI